MLHILSYGARLAEERRRREKKRRKERKKVWYLGKSKSHRINNCIINNYRESESEPEQLN